jgi:poly(ADP-ribose) glycohydrolase ARH3
MRKMIEEERLRDRFRGAMLGVAVGDALGAPFEGMGVVNHAALERLEAEPGPLRYTDDTHMTLGVAESLVERRGFDGEYMAMTFAKNYRQEPWRGYGTGPPQVFRLIEQGVPWDQAGRVLFGGSGSFGNGAAMRVAPAALAYYLYPAQVVSIATQSATITHTHTLGIEGAILQACAIAYLVQWDLETPFTPTRLLHLLDGIAPSPVYHDKLRRMETLLPGADSGEVMKELGNGIAAYEAVPAALYTFLRNPNSFSTAVLYAISLGGDTDTIASMAGALLGAYLGESAIPPVWHEEVESASRLRELADQLLELALEIGSKEEEHSL